MEKTYFEEHPDDLAIFDGPRKKSTGNKNLMIIKSVENEARELLVGRDSTPANFDITLCDSGGEQPIHDKKNPL